MYIYEPNFQCLKRGKIADCSAADRNYDFENGHLKLGVSTVFKARTQYGIESVCLVWCIGRPLVPPISVNKQLRLKN